ncbi:MAG TPA: sugar ABC transporter ATP-binding protein [Vicinamibacterales bacterium]|nr:sugar ABC transporter ATP-binding protein [Vicinamibacterales bacterium]
MPDTPPPLLVMRGIAKSFPGVRALDEARLELERGEVHVLLGENGAGKSTLMKILSGACRRDAGEIAIDGVPVALSTPREAQAAGISTIYQEFNLVPHLTVAENICLGREPAVRWGVLSARALHAEAVRVLGALDSPIDPGARVDSLSVAEQQMVEVAKALSVDARIVIMDEPTSALTESEIDQLFAAIDRLTARGAAIIYISHRLQELERIGRRATVMRDGRYIATLPLPAPIPELVRLMANRDVSQAYPARTRTRGDELLRVEDVARAPRLRGVSLTLHRGEILGIAGLMGAGRTELARVIAGADRPDRGRITLHGRVVSLRSPADAIRAGVGLVPEDRKRHGFVPGGSVAANVALPQLRRLGRAGIVDGAAERALATRWIEELRVRTPGPDTPVASLSGGNQQKVVLAKWLAAGADVLIVDEPTRGIDVASKMEIYQLLDRLAASGAGILMISSDLPEVLGMSDRVLAMHLGRITGEFDGARATQAAVLQAALGLAS